MAARHRLPAGFRPDRVRKRGTEQGWNAGMAGAMAALYGHLPPLSAAEMAQHEHDAALVPYRKQQQELALVLPETT